MTGRVEAVCVVFAERDAPSRRSPRTAIDKRPVSGPVRVGTGGVTGDHVCDTKFHGGRDKAVYAYAAEESDRWGTELGRVLAPGWFGENLRVAGVPTTDAVLDPAVAARLTRDAAGLVAAVVQQHDTGEVLMLGWMDDEALRRTLTEGRVTFWSRSRQEYWRKGDTSGHVQHVRSVALDCDGDALLVRVDQVGVACHTGDRTCFDAGDLGAVVGGEA